ncbi:MAG: 2-C-methyl-D-erythritol 4-phosphate cytidylyltransferase [Lachnospiraceae bacterium]|nr:2-C-methyl-D-erythritol 4-phosphate cytidylyltransferase [Lachnospiraceae bacterium]
MKVNAIVLAGGRGKRMGSSIPKQYMELCGKPVLYYSLKAFEDSFIDNVIIVCGAGDEDYVRKEIVIKYGITKVTKIVAGGKERYHSVYNGLIASGGCDYVYIHDGARPLIDQYILERCQHYVEKFRAAVAAAKAKDTIKIENGDGFIKSTPDRSLVWLMQTPQVFEYRLVKDAYEKLIDQESRLLSAGVSITDDTMVVKMFEEIDARLVENPKSNLKITTPEDLEIAAFLMEKYARENV